MNTFSCLNFLSNSLFTRHHRLALLDYHHSFSNTFHLIFLCRDVHGTLISLSPKNSQATYFDSGSLEKKKNYDKIKEVLDVALTGYAATEGTTFVRTKVKFGRHVFNHVTEFPCMKQPESSKKEAYYTLHHTRAFLLDQHNSTLPDHLKQWAEAKAQITDSDIGQEMYRI